MTQDTKTVAVYNSKTADYADFVKADKPDPRLTGFISAIPAGGNVLDLGCGPGHAAAAMRDAGLDVTAIDASVEMAGFARRTHDLDVTIATFDEISGTDIYDGIWASFSLLHTRKTDFPDHLSALHQALRPKGRFVIGMKTGSGEKRDTLGRFYAYYTQDELHDLLKRADFTLISTETGAEPGLDGTTAPWIIITAHA